MADDSRPFAKLYRAIWRDPEFLALDGGPQRMFMLLLTQPNITLAGTIPLQYTKWSRLSGDGTPETVRDDVAALAERCFVIVDEITEELLVRTLMRNDTLWNRSPTVQLGILRHCLKVESPLIRCVLADELELCLPMFVATEKLDVHTQAKAAMTELHEACIETGIETGVDTTADSRQQTADSRPQTRRQQTADRRQQNSDSTPQTSDLRNVTLGRGSGGGVCKNCGDEFDAHHPNAKYCSNACRQAAYKQRAARAPGEEQSQ